MARPAIDQYHDVVAPALGGITIVSTSNTQAVTLLTGVPESFTTVDSSGDSPPTVTVSGTPTRTDVLGSAADAGGFSSITSDGTSPPTITLYGGATADASYDLEIVDASTPSATTWRFRVDGGAWQAGAAFDAGAGGSGAIDDVTVTFPIGTYNDDQSWSFSFVIPRNRYQLRVTDVNSNDVDWEYSSDYGVSWTAGATFDMTIGTSVVIEGGTVTIPIGTYIYGGYQWWSWDIQEPALGRDGGITVTIQALGNDTYYAIGDTGTGTITTSTGALLEAKKSERFRLPSGEHAYLYAILASSTGTVRVWRSDRP